MKRLRYILWGLVKCIELELEPKQCDKGYLEVSGDKESIGCLYQYCELPAGHPGKHQNVVGIQYRW
jgi:hypothetical protein